MLKPLTGDVNNIDHFPTMQCFVGKPCVPKLIYGYSELFLAAQGGPTQY